MAIKELASPDNRLRRGRFIARPGYAGPILLAIAAMLAVLYMVFGDRLYVGFDVPPVSTSAPATPSTPIPATK
jgi:hypothetical protein